MDLERAEDYSCNKISSRQRDAVSVTSAALPNGKRISLLKTLLTSACERHCNYCPFRSDRDYRRATLKPGEMAKVVEAFHKAGIIQGLFLSSGIAGGGIRIQDQLIETAEILRFKYRYDGYIHLKVMPGAEVAQIERTMQLADRVSINLEAPNAHRLGLLAPEKIYLYELFQPIQYVQRVRLEQSPHLGWNGRWPSLVSQFVVGAVGESDHELLSTSEQLFKNFGLRRIYYSRFNPVPDTPFENLTPTPLLREHRLYQASYLLRDYGFSLNDLPLESNGNLPISNDPKTAWAKIHLSSLPIEINLANRNELLRVPGFGPKSVNAIMKARKRGVLLEIEDLKKIGLNPERSLPFILLDGKRPVYQQVLW